MSQAELRDPVLALKPFEHRGLQHMPARASDHARAVDALAILVHVAAADRTLVAAAQTEGAIVVAFGHGTGAARTMIRQPQHTCTFDQGTGWGQDAACALGPCNPNNCLRTFSVI